MTTDVSALARKPGLLGVCSGIAEDFGGFNPEYLRVAFVAAMLWDAYVVAGVYLTLAIVVAISRLVVPNTKKARRSRPAFVAQAAATVAPALDHAEAA